VLFRLSESALQILFVLSVLPESALHSFHKRGTYDEGMSRASGFCCPRDDDVFCTMYDDAGFRLVAC
jgi:hypothetical protein